jgi:hypothetical protein
MDCVDLRPICKERRWRYRLEESFKAEKDPREREQVAWYVEVLCQHGLIYPWGEEDLLAWTKGPVIRGKLGQLDLKRHQSGDGEAVFRFHKDRLDEVAAILRPRMRAVRSPEQREAARARLQKWQLTHKNSTPGAQKGGDLGQDSPEAYPEGIVVSSALSALLQRDQPKAPKEAKA